jgi:hypothetical protein
MQIKSLELDEDEDPEFITARMSVKEAAYLATLTGKQSSSSANEFMRGGAEANTGVYDALTGGVFNRYFDGGVQEYVGYNA